MAFYVSVEAIVVFRFFLLNLHPVQSFYRIHIPQYRNFLQFKILFICPAEYQIIGGYTERMVIGSGDVQFQVGCNYEKIAQRYQPRL